MTAPRAVERIDTVSAQEMLAQTSRNFPWCSTLIMAAAVADFRPARPEAQKIKKQGRGLNIEMESIADQLPQLAARKGDRLLVGFAAETGALEENARDKLKRKRLDLIVANDVTLEGAGFGTDTNIVTLIGRDGTVERHPKLAKDDVADLILDRLVSLRAGKTRPLRAVRSSS